MSSNSKESGKLFYSIGEVAKMFNVNASLIRFWEKEFDIIKPRKNKKGNRLFTAKDITHFKLIYSLVKEKGYTLDGAKKSLKEDKESLLKQNELVEKLKLIKSVLTEVKAELS